MKKQPFREEFAGKHPHMRPTVANLISALLLFLLVNSMALAENRYISDQLEVQIFSGEGVEHPVVATLSAGNKVELLSSNSGNGFSNTSQPRNAAVRAT